MHWLDSEVAHVSDLTKNYIITMAGFRVTDPQESALRA